MPARLAWWHRIICLGAIALMLTVPFLLPHHYNPIPTFFQEWTAGALGLVALSWLLRQPAGEPLEFPEIALLPVGLMLIAVIQALFQPDALTDRLLLFALYMVWAILLIMLGRRLATQLGRETLADILATAILIGALLAALTGAVQLAGLARLPWFFPHLGGSLRGNLGQANNFADYLWLGLAATIYLRARGWLGLASTLGALIILVPFSVLSGSRSVWFYGAGLVVLSLAWTVRPPSADNRRLRHASLVALIATGVFQVLFSSGLIPLPETAITAGGRLADVGSYDSVRPALWRQAWEIFIDHPWLGAGFGQYTRQFLAHVLDLMPRRLPGLPENAHNVLLNLLAEMGLGAGVLLVGLGIRWLWGLWRCPHDAANWWIAASALVIALHAHLEYPLWYAFFLGLAALLAGAGSTGNYRLDAGPRAPYAVAAFLLLGGVAMVNLRQDYTLLEDTLYGRFAAASPEAAQEYTEQALRQLARESLLRPYVDLTAANLMDEGPEALEIKLATCDRAQRFSASREIIFKCAHLLALAGHQAEAELALRRAVAAYPDRAELVRQQWQQRRAKEPAIARLLANFPPIVGTPP